MCGFFFFSLHVIPTMQREGSERLNGLNWAVAEERKEEGRWRGQLAFRLREIFCIQITNFELCTQNKIFPNWISICVGWTISVRERKRDKLMENELLVAMTGDPHRRMLTDASCNNLCGGTDAAWSATWNTERETEWLWEGKTAFCSLSWNLLVMSSSLMTSLCALEQRATAQWWLPGDSFIMTPHRSDLLSAINSVLSVEHGHAQMQCNS